MVYAILGMFMEAIRILLLVLPVVYPAVTALGFDSILFGISGDASEKDEYCAILAIKATGYASVPPEPDPNWQGASMSGVDH